ncbi:MAG: type II/IV secretion system ATPase subunit [Erysipelotrichales bacterium]|nr:type II/IV secretion system ATPase subunit [Erysipelotrichales bacterium]
MLNSIFDQMDFGPLQEFLDDEDVTDISYSNGGQVWLKTLSKGIFQINRPDINNTFMEKLAFQCSNVMGKTFNMAHPFLDAESAELRMNFVHDSIATNGIACLVRKTPAKIRLNKDKLLNEQYITEKLHDFLLKCIEGHCNIMVAGETGSGKTELVKYLASKTKDDEKIITIEDTLELHLDKIFPTRDIVAMKTNNIASYTESLVACMRQNPIWILLAEVRSAEAVMAVRNSISSGHHILSTIHADKASSIPMRMYSLLESSQDIEQFLGSIHRYVQIGIYVKGYFSKRLNRFQREIIEVCEFYVDNKTQEPKSNMLYQKQLDGRVIMRNPTQYLRDYLSIGNVELGEDPFGIGNADEGFDDTNRTAAEASASSEAPKAEVHSADDPFNMNGDDTANGGTQPAQAIQQPTQQGVQQPAQATQPQVVATQPAQQTQAVKQQTPVQQPQVQAPAQATAPTQQTVQGNTVQPTQVQQATQAVAQQPQTNIKAVQAQPLSAPAASPVVQIPAQQAA